MEITSEHVASCLSMEVNKFLERAKRKSFLTKSGGISSSKVDIVFSTLKKDWKKYFGVNFIDLIDFKDKYLKECIGKLLKGRDGPFVIYSPPDKRQSLDMSCKYIYCIISLHN